MYFRNPADLPLVEGAYFSTHFSSEMPGEAVRAFNRLHQRAYERLPTPAGALTYDAFRLLFSVIRSQGDASPAGICGAARAAQLRGVTGTMIFAGSPIRPKRRDHPARDRQYRFHARIDPRRAGIAWPAAAPQPARPPGGDLFLFSAGSSASWAR
jgi:hypothetical protein